MKRTSFSTSGKQKSKNDLNAFSKTLSSTMSEIKTNTATYKNKTYGDCHWLPCKIDYDGLAPVQVHFRPEPISKNDLSIETSSRGATQENVNAVSFRGRGLLAASRDQSLLPNHIIGSVMIPTIDSEGDTIVVMKEQFDSVFEWEHESDEKRIISNHGKQEIDDDNRHCHNIKSRSSVGRGVGILEVLQSVHDPIPI